MDKIIIDSDILISVSRNYPTAIAFLDNLERSRILAISTVSAIELIVGCQNKVELVRVRKFLTRFDHLHIDETVSERTLFLVEQYNLSHALLLPDALIAATALVSDIELATINRKDFRYIDGLKLVDYP
jgi:predicted nucleic acid-binding protein